MVDVTIKGSDQLVVEVADPDAVVEQLQAARRSPAA
jgi:hypothetical protein